MKIFLFAALLTAASAGVALAQGWHPYDRSCVGNNSKQCVDARNAFAEHHNGMYPEQWDNQWYQGHQGRWIGHANDWRWEGSDGEQYRRVHDKWEWVKHHH
jgi:hypothetical protein